LSQRAKPRHCSNSLFRRIGWQLAIGNFKVPHSLPHETGKPQTDVARQILSYFLRNPEAVDSLVGIARWRLLEEEIYRSVADTESALNWLIAHRYLKEAPVQGTERVFQLNPEKRREAESFLKSRRKR
jgi:hypothetical protein